MNKKQAQTQLDIIKNVHERHLQWGYKVLNDLACSENDITVTYANEWRGRYGFCPAIYITLPGYNQPTGAMIPVGAYKYIIAGMFRYADVTIACKGHC